MSDSSTVVKKVRPYPIPATIDIQGVKKPIEISVVNLKGAIVRLNEVLVSVGEYHQLEFELPVLKTLVSAQIRVIKTYDRSIDPKVNKIERLAELHFQNLDEINRTTISKFMAAIGQTE